MGPDRLTEEQMEEATRLAKGVLSNPSIEDSYEERTLARALIAAAFSGERRGEDDEIRADFEKCYDIAMLASSYWPELADSWTGTVSERLARTLGAEHEARQQAEIAVLAAERRGLERAAEVVEQFDDFEYLTPEDGPQYHSYVDGEASLPKIAAAIRSLAPSTGEEK